MKLKYVVNLVGGVLFAGAVAFSGYHFLDDCHYSYPTSKIKDRGYNPKTCVYTDHQIASFLFSNLGESDDPLEQKLASLEGSLKMQSFPRYENGNLVPDSNFELNKNEENTLLTLTLTNYKEYEKIEVHYSVEDVKSLFDDKITYKRLLLKENNGVIFPYSHDNAEDIAENIAELAISSAEHHIIKTNCGTYPHVNLDNVKKLND